MRRCSVCGNLAEADLCPICANEKRDHTVVCVVEHIPDLVAIERSHGSRNRGGELTVARGHVVERAVRLHVL